MRMSWALGTTVDFHACFSPSMESNLAGRIRWFIDKSRLIEPNWARQIWLQMQCQTLSEVLFWYGSSVETNSNILLHFFAIRTKGFVFLKEKRGFSCPGGNVSFAEERAVVRFWKTFVGKRAPVRWTDPCTDLVPRTWPTYYQDTKQLVVGIHSWNCPLVVAYWLCHSDNHKGKRV